MSRTGQALPDAAAPLRAAVSQALAALDGAVGECLQQALLLHDHLARCPIAETHNTGLDLVAHRLRKVAHNLSAAHSRLREAHEASSGSHA